MRCSAGLGQLGRLGRRSGARIVEVARRRDEGRGTARSLASGSRLGLVAFLHKSDVEIRGSRNRRTATMLFRRDAGPFNLIKHRTRAPNLCTHEGHDLDRSVSLTLSRPRAKIDRSVRRLAHHHVCRSTLISRLGNTVHTTGASVHFPVCRHNRCRLRRWGLCAAKDSQRAPLAQDRWLRFGFIIGGCDASASRRMELV